MAFAAGTDDTSSPGSSGTVSNRSPSRSAAVDHDDGVEIVAHERLREPDADIGQRRAAEEDHALLDAGPGEPRGVRLAPLRLLLDHAAVGGCRGGCAHGQHGWSSQCSSVVWTTVPTAGWHGLIGQLVAVRRTDAPTPVKPAVMA